MAQQNGCSMDLAEDGLEGVEDGLADEDTSAMNGHASSSTEVDTAAAFAAGPSSSSATAISRVDRDVIRLIAQHLQNLGLKYDSPS